MSYKGERRNSLQSSLLAKSCRFWSSSYNSYEFIRSLLLFGDFLEEPVAGIKRLHVNFYIHFSSYEKPSFHPSGLWREACRYEGSANTEPLHKDFKTRRQIKLTRYDYMYFPSRSCDFGTRRLDGLGSAALLLQARSEPHTSALLPYD